MKVLDPKASSIALGLALLWVAAPAAAADLSASVAHAMTYDPTLQASNYARKAGQEKRKQATSLYLPQISVNGGYTRQHVNTRVSTPSSFQYQVLAPSSSTGNIYGYGITLTQPLYNVGISVKAAKYRNQARLAEIDNHHAHQNLIAQVAQAYFNVIVGKETLHYVQAEKKAVAHQLASAKARFKAGRTNITDVQDAQTRYDSIVAEEVSAENNLSQWQARYQRFVGQPPQNLQHLPRDFLPTPPVPNDIDVWLARAIRDNPGVQGKQIQQHIAEKNIDLYTLSGRPKLNLVAGYTDTRQSGDLSMLVAPDHAESMMVGVQLTIPIFAGGRIVSQLHEARATNTQAIYDVRAARADVKLQVQQTFQDIDAGISRIRSLKQAATAAKTSLDANKLALKVGTKSTQDVLDAEQTYYQTLKDLSQARYQYLMAKINLKLLTGDLNEAYVSNINQLLGDT